MAWFEPREFPVRGPPVVGVVPALVVSPGLSLLPMLSWSLGMYAWWTGRGAGEVVREGGREVCGGARDCDWGEVMEGEAWLWPWIEVLDHLGLCCGLGEVEE